MLKLGIRVSSASSSGRGHFERCLAIRNHIKEKVFWFLDSESKYIKNNISKIDEIFYENGKNKYGNLKNLILNDDINCILIDSYQINIKAIYNISNKIPIIVFVDKNIIIKANIIICPHPIDLITKVGVKYLNGPKYAPISNKFVYKGNKTYLRNKILISFGTHDSLGITLNAIMAIKNLIISESLDTNIVITLAKESPIINEVKTLIKSFSNFELLLDFKNMEDLYKNCNMAIGAPGLSYLERLASGLPSLLIAQNKIHDSLIDKWIKLGCGIKSDNSIQSIQENLKFLMLNDDLRKKMIIMGRNLIDGKGASRIASEIVNVVISND
jgi:spore coat polysaccharide biosynthesis predicted glycosyltransferase SpsG